MDFTNEFIEEVQKNRPHLLSLLERREPNELESHLKRELLTHWHSLPPAESSSFREFSVDSSSASRTLANGVDLFYTRALMLRSDGSPPYKKIRLDARRGIPDPDDVSKLESILRDLIEIQIVVENCPESTGDLVLIDGNLYGRYTHLMQQIDIKGREHLPLLLFEAMQQMFEMCSEKGIYIVGVSKFSKTRALSNAFLNELNYPRGAVDIPDVEMLYQWKKDWKGYTTPLLLGEYAFKEEAPRIRDEPRRYLRRYFRDLPKDRWDWGVEVMKKMPLAPAIAMFHVILDIDEQPLRIDVPANCLGMKDRMLDVSPFRFIDPDVVVNLLKQLLADRGGRDVYNALLYVVDREVRLSRKTVDTIYKSILGKELNMSIEYDRSTRRFYG